MHILVKSIFFKVLNTNFEIQYFFNTFDTAWEPCLFVQTVWDCLVIADVWI